LVGGLPGWLVGWLVGWSLPGWLGGWVVGWLVEVSSKPHTLVVGEAMAELMWPLHLFLQVALVWWGLWRWP